ncbi:MAG: hypothetical protein V4621_04370 [Pseudomonadota bacterium]
MSQSYLEKRVKAAIAEAKGSKAGARKLLLTWAINDQQLLLSLSRRHLPALAAQAVEFVLAGLTAHAAGQPKPVKPGENIGKDILAALGGRNAATFGQEDAAPPLSKRAASQQHIDAIHKMAKSPVRKS